MTEERESQRVGGQVLGGNGEPYMLLAASNSKGGQEMSPVVRPGEKGNWFGDQLALFALGPQHLGDSSKTSLEVGGPVLYLLCSLFENHVYPGQYPQCESLGDPEKEARQSSPTSHQGHHGHDWGLQRESPPSTNWKSDIHPPASTGKVIEHPHLRAHSPAPWLSLALFLPEESETGKKDRLLSHKFVSLAEQA